MTKRKLKQLNEILYKALLDIRSFPVRDRATPEVTYPDIDDFHMVNMELFHDCKALIGKAKGALCQYALVCMGENKQECRNFFCPKKKDCEYSKWSYQRGAVKDK